jgi:hypothetical protein
MRFSCEFEHRKTGERKTIMATLTAEEVRCVQGLTEHAEINAMAFALKHAYAEVPKGFLHTEPPTAIASH